MSGRAIDIKCDSTTPALKSKGDAVLDALTRDNALLARSMGIQQILWNRQVWDARHPERGVHPMNKEDIGNRKIEAHNDHIHLELNNAGAHHQTSFWQLAAHH